MLQLPLYLFYNYTLDPLAQIDIIQFARLVHAAIIETYQVVRNNEEKTENIEELDDAILNITSCVMFSTMFSDSELCTAFDPTQNVEYL